MHKQSSEMNDIECEIDVCVYTTLLRYALGAEMFTIRRDMMWLTATHLI